MISFEKSAENIISKFSDLLIENGYEVSSPAKGQYNFEVSVTNGRDKLKLLVYFGKKGNKTVLQGNPETRFYNDVRGLVFGETLFSNEPQETEEPQSYIGTDESGKGDYFGPLIVAGVFAEKETLVRLKKIGVRDSKLITDKVINSLAGEIKEIIGDKYSIVIINPAKYNELYKKIGNVNRLLGWAHARVLENILEKHNAPEAISDKFGDEKLIKDSLQTKGREITLRQFTKAEKYTAVAAASILAREKVNSWFDITNKKLGINIPKGASSKVEETALKIKSLHGKEKLDELVKLHFKTTRKIGII